MAPVLYGVLTPTVAAAWARWGMISTSPQSACTAEPGEYEMYCDTTSLGNPSEPGVYTI